MRATPGRNVTAAVIAAVLSSTAPSAADAKTLVVAVTGSDNGGCGGKATPCRSISQAVANAAAGDKIVVGPGRYGDIDADGVLGEPGEEAAGGVLITIAKPLTIESRDGAPATIIDAGDTAADHVRIHADGVVFGKPKKGFTIRKTSAGYGIMALASPGTGVVVAGNRAVGVDVGFTSVAPGMLLTGNSAVGCNRAGFLLWSAGTRLIGNEALSNRYGVEAESDGRQAQIIGNTITGNLLAGIDIDEKDGAVITGNVVSGNLGDGIRAIANDVSISGNVLNGNGDAGVYAAGARIAITKNTVYANVGPGVVITAPSQDVTATGNNFAGNDRADQGCGVFKFTDDAVDATGSFWGAPTGPGPGPADQACDDTSANNLGTTPFAPKEIKIKPKPPKIG